MLSVVESICVIVTLTSIASATVHTSLMAIALMQWPMCNALTNLSLLWIFGVSVQETKGIIPTPIFSEGAGREY